MSEYKISMKRRKGDIRVALAAALMAMLASSFLFALLPDVRVGMTVTHRELFHPRSYEKHSGGGRIVYAVDSSEKRRSGDELSRFVEDLEILSRRFARGDFHMMAIAGSRRSPAVAQVSLHAHLYRYEVVNRGDSVALHIRAPGGNRDALQALHDYLAYLESRWFVDEEEA